MQPEKKTKVISQKIVGFKLKDEAKEAAKVEDTAPAADAPEEMHEKIARPELLLGSTYKIKTPMADHALYITINDVLLNEGTEYQTRQPFEIFINSKNLEHYQWVVALTRVISAVFRKGGDCTFLAEELKAVFDPQGGYYKGGGRFMPSLVAEIGDAIEDHLKNIGLIQDEELSDVQREILEEKKADYCEKNQENTNDKFPSSSTLCLKCYTKAVIVMDGCKTCLSCGDSKCG